MATIVTKNSSTASAVPTTSDLVQGELAVNVTDKRIFTENASTQIVELGTNPSTITTGSATVTGTLTANGTFASNNAVITGGSINSTPIGATTPSTVRGSTVTATTGFVGGLTGNVTGNLTGNVTGNVVGNLTGNVTGNVTASTGTTTLNNLVVNGTADFTNTKLTNITTPTLDSDAANKGYVDATVAAVIDSAPAALDTLNELAAALGDDANFSATVTTALATKLPLAGGTMSGAIAMGTSKITGLGDPTASQDAATKIYVDTADNLKLNLSGGTMSGAIAMGTNKITGLGDPTLAQDAATKAYTDSILGSATSAAASAAAAATSESNAATSASNASTSETNALNSANAAASSYDQFDDRYLGDKASDPTLDNDGNALLTGALYFNTTTDVMRVYNGSAWQDTAISPNSPTFTGTVTADGLTVNGDITQSDNNPLYTISDTDGGASQLDFGGGSVVINADKDSEYTNRVIQLQVQGVKGFQLLDGGDISFYEDTGTTPKFFWDASAERLGIGNSSPSDAYLTAPNIVLGSTSDTFSGITLFTSSAGSQRILFADGTSGTDNRVGQLSYDHSNNSMAFTTSATERLRIDATGNVGIGTSTPSTALSGTATVLEIANVNIASVKLSNTGAGAKWELASINDGSFRIYDDNAEKLRIDLSGNLLVGKTANNVTTAGVNLNSSGYVSSSVSSNPAAYFNRGTSDGNIAVFLKNGTAVGSIGTYVGDLTIGTGDVGLWFQDGGNAIRPFRVDTNVGFDASISLGVASERFKDAHFSGTVNANAFVGDGSGLTGVGGGGAMELISTTTVSGTPSTIDITSGFSSTYDDYIIYGSGITVSNADDGRVRIYKGGSLLTSSDYTYFNRNGTSVSSRTSFDEYWGINTGGSASGFKISIVNANSSKFSISCFGGYRSSGTGWNHSGSGSVTGIRIYPASGTFTAGTIRLYGIKKS